VGGAVEGSPVTNVSPLLDASFALDFLLTPTPPMVRPLDRHSDGPHAVIFSLVSQNTSNGGDIQEKCPRGGAAFS